MPSHFEHHPMVQQFAVALQATSFRGEIDLSFSARLAIATDNSVYQVIPSGVIYPMSHDDVVLVLQVAQDDRFDHLSFTCRGGGTGTDGQSLTEGLIIDFSRYMTRILRLDLEEGTVLVEPGVVLDQLNDYLRPYGYFFPVLISPSTRATMGGMFGTDACGQGSCQYGRLSDYLEQVDGVFSDGSEFSVQTVDRDALMRYESSPGVLGVMYRLLPACLASHYQFIQARFPKMPRGMNGYNLAEAYHFEKGFRPQKLFAGSEGTLCIATRLKLSFRPIPKHYCLLVVAYRSFSDALKSGRAFLKQDLSAIETVDGHVLSVARKEPFYQELGELFPALQGPVEGLNLFEIQSDNLRSIELRYAVLERMLQENAIAASGMMGFHFTSCPLEIAKWWDLRKKSVGLLANLPGSAQPVPFIEDTAVPPECLPEYIEQVQVLLESYGLTYGLFGHVDAGCLHVRPALNMSDPEHQALIPLLTAQICELVKSFGGVLCGEHGTGYRTRPAAQFFGDTLMRLLSDIKTMFDPKNKLNPGKIAAPEGELYQEQLVHVSGPFRGEQDAQVDQTMREIFQGAFKCNGNAACLDQHPDTVMCPSGKVMKSRLHTPKGRSALLREWAKRVTHNPALLKRQSFLKRLQNSWKKESERDFSQDVYQVLAGCLGCKACRTNCPVKVDIPQMKSIFLSYYHGRYTRRFRDFAIKHLETLLMWQNLFPQLSRAFLSNGLIIKLLEWSGLYHVPLVDEKSLSKRMKEQPFPIFSPSVLQHQSRIDEVRTVFLIQDIFTSSYEPGLVMTMGAFLKALGYQVYLLPFYRNGKPSHVVGDLALFHKIAKQQNKVLKAIGARGLPIIGIDPSMTLVYRDEYRHMLGPELSFEVSLLQEWLSKEVKKQGTAAHCWLALHQGKMPSQQKSYALFLHCSESTMVPNSSKEWVKIFQAFGLTAYPVEVGCCGMSGPYGHLAEHQQHSSDLYQMSWASKIRESENHRIQPLITGFSCRCQVDRYEPKNTARHPVEILYQTVVEYQQSGHHRSTFLGEHAVAKSNKEVPLYV